MNAAARHILHYAFTTTINGITRRKVVAESSYIHKAGLSDKVEKVTCERFGRQYIVINSAGEAMRAAL